jgi:TrmH family RNA methyltransferase
MVDEPSPLVITSAANPVVKRIRALATGRPLHGDEAFFCEGPQPVWRAADAGARIEMLVVAPDLLRGSPSEQLVEEQEAKGVPVVRLTSELFRRVSDRDGPAGLAAVVQPSRLSVNDLEVGDDAVFVVLHEVANPGNLGSILRTADAAGVAGVILTGVTAKPYSAAAVKASMGSIFNVSVATEAEIRHVIDWAHSTGVQVATTSAHAAASYLEVPFPRPIALVFGNEGRGLSDDVLSLGDLQVKIPMVGSASSLNLSVAVGVLLFEVQRGRLMGRHGG